MSDADRKTILDKCQDIIKWLDGNQLAEKEEFEHKQKEIEGVCNPIITKLYQVWFWLIILFNHMLQLSCFQSAGGMPGGFPGAPGAGGAGGGQAGGASGGAAGGPTIEEVDWSAEKKMSTW